MTYKEIEAILKRFGRNSTIERLRVAVGEEADELTGEGVKAQPARRNELAREYYAESITKWIEEGGSPDPHTLLEHRARYVTSWAFAEIIAKLQGGESEVEEEEVGVGDEILLRICDANSQLGLQLVQLIRRVEEMSAAAIASVTVERIREALDAAGVSGLNELGNRKLDTWERVEALLVENRRLAAMDHTSVCTTCIERERNERDKKD